MATYSEIDSLLNVNEATGLRRRVAVATMVAADKIRLEADAGTSESRARKRFAQALFRASVDQPSAINNSQTAYAFSREFEAVYRLVLISNRTATLAQITGATDAVIQTAADAAVDHLAGQYFDPVAP